MSLASELQGSLPMRRESVATLIGAMSTEVIFTSGATEANNLALLGTATPVAIRRKIIVSAIEHKSILEAAAHLEKTNFEIVRAPVDRHGQVDLASFEALVDEHTLLVSLMAANNETGVLQPVAEVVALAHAQGALVHCDGAQAVGKIPINVFDLDVDYLSLSSHKMYGPMGIGALYVSSNAPRLAPQSFGGGQQGGLSRWYGARASHCPVSVKPHVSPLETLMPLAPIPAPYLCSCSRLYQIGKSAVTLSPAIT